jgi:hypothetical protein
MTIHEHPDGSTTIKLKARVVHEHPTDGSETIEVGIHQIQYGHGSGGDGFCYNCQSFDSFDVKPGLKEAKEAVEALPPVTCLKQYGIE